MGMLLIGNLISLIGAVFMAISCVAKEKKQVFFHQFLSSAVLTVSSVILNSFSGAVSMALCALRNLIVARGKYTKPVMWFFCISAVVLGLAANTRGLLGVVPVLSTVQYTLGIYYASTERAVKYNIMANVTAWMVYSFLILDISTAVSEAVMLIICIEELLRMDRKPKAACS